MDSSFTLSKIRATAVGLFVAASLAFATGTAANAQRKKAQDNEANKITGKLVSVSKKGRNTILTVKTAEKGEQEFIINARVEFTVIAKGDKAFLSSGQFVWIEAVQSNNILFTKLCTVVLSGNRRKPKPVFTKAPPAPRRSTNAYWVAGMIVSLRKDEEYPDYDSLTIKIGGKVGKVLLEKGYTVMVKTSDPDLAKAGATVVLEGKPTKGNRFLLAKATIKLDDTFKAEDFLAKGSRSKKKRSKK